MRRRLLATLVGIVAAGLLAAGLGTLLLVRLAAYDTTAGMLENRATTLAAVIGDSVATDVHNPLARGRMQRLSRSLGVENIGAVVAMPRTDMPARVLAELPEGLSLADLDTAALVADGVSSGRVGDRVWAAATFAPQDRPAPAVVVVVTGSPAAPLGPAGRWFLLAALLTLATVVVVAVRLSRGLARPLIEATEATRRIAGGDLSARLSEPSPSRHDEAAELARAVNAMAEGLDRSRGLERQFLLSVSHDLRTPMTSIQGYAEALCDGTIEDPVMAGGVILDEARRLDRLIRDLLDLARLDSRRFQLDLVPADVGAATERSAYAFAPVAASQDTQLMVEVQPGAVARIDADRWGQVVANLVENALRHANSRVVIAVDSPEGFVRLSVADDGPGIAEEDLPHVFERLYVSKRRPSGQESGSGLGLAIVRELVQAMGGSVYAESPGGGGARIVVTMPSGA